MTSRVRLEQLPELIAGAARECLSLRLAYGENCKYVLLQEDMTAPRKRLQALVCELLEEKRNV